MKDVYFLIKSLSKSEKRYFGIENQREENTKFFSLYKELQNLDNCSIEELENNLKSSNFSYPYLSDDLNFLYKKLLQSLNNFSKNHYKKNKLSDELNFCRILFEKNLLNEAEKQLASVRKLIVKYELYYASYEWIDLLYKIYGSRYALEKVLKLTKNAKELTLCLEEINHMRELYLTCNLLIKNWPIGKLEFEEILKTIPSQKVGFLKTKSAQIKALQIHQIYFFLERDYTKEHHYLNQIIQLIERDFKEFKQENDYEYIIIYSRMLYLQMALKEIPLNKVVTNFLALPNNTKTSNTSLSFFVKIYAYNFILEYFIRNNAYVEAAQFALANQLHESKLKDKANEHLLISALYKSAYCHYKVGNFENCIDYINIIEHLFDSNVRFEVNQFIKLFKLIVHFDLGNYNLVNNLLKQYKVQFKKANPFYNAFKLLSQMLLPLSALPKNKQGIMFHDLYVEMQHGKHTETINQINKYFSLYEWFDIKLNQQKEEKVASPVFLFEKIF